MAIDLRNQLKSGQAITPWDPKTPNADIIAEIWKHGSMDFQKRVPEPTKANLDAAIRAITRYEPGYNEFAGTLINKAGRTIARTTSWQNKLAAYKLGMLEFGESIEEYKLGLIKAKVFDPRRAYGEAALFGRHPLAVQTSYHTIGRENRYDLTVEHPVLKRAFLSPSGLAQFASDMMTVPTTSDNWDEFLIMADLFRKYEEADGFFKIHIDPLTDQESSQAFLEVLREYAEIMPYLSERYNAAHMPAHADAEDLTLFINPKAKAKIDVQALAQLFNVSYGEIPYKVQVMPEEYFFGVGAEIQAVLTTSDFFVCADTYFDINSQPNPAGRYENWFLHHDGIYSVSRFVPAIAFTTGAGTVEAIEALELPTGISGITLTDSEGVETSGNTIERGEAYLMNVSALDGDYSAIRFEATGFESPFSFIENTGELYISPDDGVKNLVVAAISVADGNIRNIVEYSVTGAVISLWYPVGVLPDADGDGKTEVTPLAPRREGNEVTIPSVRGIQYTYDGTNANNNSKHTVAKANTAVTAVARDGYELAPGVTTSWTYSPA